MKTLFTFATLTLIAASANAQWQSDMRLTNSVGASTLYANSNKCIAASGNDVHAVWQDARNGNADVFYKRSTDGGATWENDVALVTDTVPQQIPSIAVSGSTVHVVWEDARDGGNEIYYRRSNDGGATWLPDVKISNQGFNLGQPSIAAEGNNVHVVWMETSPMFIEDVYHIASTDGGVTWGSETKLTQQESDETQPTVAVSGNFVHVAWQDHRFYPGADWNDEIYYIGSTNNGDTWGTEVRVSNADDVSEFPSIAASGTNVHIAWQDERTGNTEVFTRSSSNNGSTWNSESMIESDAVVSLLPSVAANGSDVHLVWVGLNMANVSQDIYYAKSSDAGASWNAAGFVTVAEGSSYSPHIAVVGTKAHVIWQDDREVSGEPSDIEIYYNRNENTSGIEAVRNHNTSFELFPNPAFNNVTIQTKSTDSERCDLVDATGKIWANGVVRGEAMVNTSELPAGVYTVRFINGAAKSFVVQKN